MFTSRFFRRIFHQRFEDIDQVKLIYLLSLIVGLLSALAGAILKNAIHYTHQLLTKGITAESGSYLYLAYPFAGMLITLLFVTCVVKVISESRRNIYPVVDEYNILEGVVSLDDVREIMFKPDLYDATIRDLMTIPPSYIDKRENIETVMDTFSKTGAWNLPVLDNGYYVGFISKSRIYSTYRELLIQFSEE